MRKRSSLDRVTAQLADPSPERSPWRSASAQDRHRRRRLLLAVLVLFVAVALVFGFPTGREVLTGWVLLTLWAACAGSLRVWGRAVVRDWLPLLLVLFAYDLLRGYAKDVGPHLTRLPTLRADSLVPTITDRAHVNELIDEDRFLFGGQVPTVWLQQHFHDVGVVHWWDALALPVYFSHFFVSLGLAVVLWAISYPVYRRYVWTLVTLSLVTVVTHALYPAAPPWMAGLPANGYLPPVDRVVSSTMRLLGGHTVNSAVERGEIYSNQVAAVPSLHGAIPLMLLLFFWPLVRRRARVLLGGYVLAMAVTLVYSGEHYVVDLLAGYLYAAACVIGVRRVLDRRDRQALAAAP